MKPLLFALALLGVVGCGEPRQIYVSARSESKINVVVPAENVFGRKSEVSVFLEPWEARKLSADLKIALGESK